jgi:hypothetical protein
MAVVAFAPLVVKANDANAIFGIDRTVFETMLGGWNRLGHPPNHQLNHGTIGRDVLESGDQFSGHVGDCANTACMLSRMTTLAGQAQNSDPGSLKNARSSVVDLLCV